MVRKDWNLEGLPLQKQLVDAVAAALFAEADVVAAVLLGSLASGKGDRVSDADVVAFTHNEFHVRVAPNFVWLTSEKEVFYELEDFHNENAYFKKYIFSDLTSAEIHYVDIKESFDVSEPYRLLFDKRDVIKSRLTGRPAPKHEDFEVYTSGDKGLIWELFDCIKWLSRGDVELAKGYLKKLVGRF